MSPAGAADRRRGGAWPLAATIAGIALGVSLGNWQLGRAAEKRELQARVEAQAAQPPISVGAAALEAGTTELRRVEARGVFEPEHTVFVDNRIREGRPGFHVITPLRVAGGERRVLVNRGWVAWAPERARLPQVRTPSAPVRIEGIAVIPGRRVLELSDEVMEGRIWQNLTIERYRKAMPLEIQPFVIRQDSALDDGLVREWDPPDFGIDKHYGYAFQWYALAATMAIFYAVTRSRRNRKPAA